MIEIRNLRIKEVEQIATAKLGQRLEATAILLSNEIKQSISEPSGDGETPSAPGEPPHKDSGRLRASISREVDKEELVARVGTNVLYGKFLEIGTVKMEARPFLRPAFYNNLARIKKLFGK